VLLDGIRVVACETGLAGPLCSRLLADFGADVVKIERPDGGDVTRAWDVAVLSADHWRELCTSVLDRPDLLADERYATNESRVAHRADLERILEDELARRAGEDWIDRLEAARIPCGRVNGIAEVMEHPQLAHNRLVAEIGSPAGPIPTIGAPFLVARERLDVGPVPALGEHTVEVLGALGFDA
jgi:itaconate CoA-transferase